MPNITFVRQLDVPSMLVNTLDGSVRITANDTTLAIMVLEYKNGIVVNKLYTVDIASGATNVGNVTDSYVFITKPHIKLDVDNVLLLAHQPGVAVDDDVPVGAITLEFIKLTTTKGASYETRGSHVIYIRQFTRLFVDLMRSGSIIVASSSSDDETDVQEYSSE